MIAETLRKAADLIEKLAAETTTQHGPWLADVTVPDPEIEDSGEDACVMVETNQAKSWAQVLFMADWGTAGDATWIAALGPQVAAPLVAWLRSEAEDAALIGACPGAVTFARAVLGEAS